MAPKRPKEARSGRTAAPRVLVIDVGGTHVKVLATGETEPRRFDSGPHLTARRMVAEVKRLAADWTWERVSIGYPGPVLKGRPVAEPHNLGKGWVRFDYAKAFGCPVRILNDAALQALGSHRGGNMLFLGLGTGLGSALVVDGVVVPLELAHLPYRKATFEDYVGARGRDRLGNKKWHRHVNAVVALLRAAMVAEDVVLGGGNVKNLDAIPSGCRAGDNANAFKGGFRLWEDAGRFAAASRR